MKRVPFTDEGVKAVFAAYPAPVRAPLLALRDLIFETAAETKSVGSLEECLKWNQPAYLTVEPRSGSTIRIDAVKGKPGAYAAYFHCQTNLVETFRQLYPGEFKFEGNRALVFNAKDALPRGALKHCVLLALTYHLRGR